MSKWSPRMREPMEAVYGVEGFPKLWFESKKLKEPSQKFNDINKDKSSCSNPYSLYCAGQPGAVLM